MGFHYVAEAQLSVRWKSPEDDDKLIQEFLEILDDALPNSRADVEKHSSEIKDVLAPIIQASPKNSDGRLDDTAARYALYRLFMERHGWVIKTFGDSAGEDAAQRSKSLPSLFSFGELVPGPVQALLEDQTDARGSSIVELSLFAAMLEHLIKDETVRGLESLFAMKRFPVDRLVPKWQAESFIDLYMACYISGRDIFNMSLKEVFEEKRGMSTTYHNWDGTQQFFRSMMESHVPVVATVGNHGYLSFKELADVLVAIVKNFVHWNNHQCSSYKAKLMEIEDHTSGRVRFLDFYRSAIKENGTSTFLESEDYLRQLGALDESNVLEPAVLISNYLEGPSNCVARTSYYSVCCMDECADLYSHLENAIGKSTATIAEIIPVVEGLNSASMQQCRTLPRTLLLRLEDIATRNGGLVELHGKDFAEWMHFAYPRECSNVKTFGPAHFMTIEEWMVESNTIPQASDDEILQTVKRLEAFEGALKEIRPSVATSWKKVSGVKVADFEEDAWSSLTWTCLFFVMSMLVLSCKLHHHFSSWKESVPASSTLAESKLTDWAEVV